jgi:hypothetical protein
MLISPFSSSLHHNINIIVFLMTLCSTYLQEQQQGVSLNKISCSGSFNLTKSFLSFFIFIKLNHTWNFSCPARQFISFSEPASAPGERPK